MPAGGAAFVATGAGAGAAAVSWRQKGGVMSASHRELAQQKIVLLFFKNYEADSFVKYDRYLKRLLRPLYQKLHRRQKKSGFAVSFELMCRALRGSGYTVRINDYRTARKNPAYPVGIVGFPSILENWTLPNPAVLGPSLYDHPRLAPDLLKDPRFRKYAVLAPWTLDVYKPVYGDACFTWFAGIDLDAWPDLSGHPKSFDFLVYDKIRWDHDALKKAMIDPIVATLKQKGLTFRLLRYAMHDHDTYRTALAEARGLLFLCEHETQGLAYQEAMASNVPVFAWDNGFWADPLWKRFGEAPPPASSVPFFSPACGETFRDMTQFDAALDRFMAKRESYAPRGYVRTHLSLERSAGLYADQYFGLLS
jgi:glycosyltransferase involved in cell wall biosynthesis